MPVQAAPGAKGAVERNQQGQSGTRRQRENQPLVRPPTCNEAHRFSACYGAGELVGANGREATHRRDKSAAGMREGGGVIGHDWRTVVGASGCGLGMSVFEVLVACTHRSAAATAFRSSKRAR